MGSISLGIPTAGQTFASEGAKVATDMTTIQTWANGNVDSTNLSSTAAITRSQMAGGFGNLAYTTVAVPTSAVDGTFYVVTAATTITLPTPTINRTIGVFNNVAGVVTVTASSGVIVGLGLTAASFSLGGGNAAVILLANGTNWVIASGQQDTGWVALSLTASVTAEATFYVPAARLQGDTVRLRGAMVNNTGGNITAGSTWATIPAGSRPAANVGFPIRTGTSVNAQVGLIGTAGLLTCNTTIANGVDMVLDGISFPLS